MKNIIRGTGNTTRTLISGIVAVVGLLMLATAARAQTPLTKIENAAGDSVFVSFDDGGLLGLGEFNTGVIPAEGIGTRMMWYPAKAAFRAGFSGGTEWDDANIGDKSVAFGSNTEASGTFSMATGTLTRASGYTSTAMGHNTIAATTSSLSIGENNSANQTADNTLLVAGNGTSSTPSDALVLDFDGNLTTAASIESQSGGFVLPDGTTLDEAGDLEGLPTNGAGSFNLSNDDGHVASGTVGTGSIPETGAGTRMMWYPAKAAFRAGDVNGTQWDDANIGNRSIAFGYNTTASALISTAMGQTTTASGQTSTAMGFSTTASGDFSTAMGRVTTASGDDATAMGFNTTAATFRSLTIGAYNSANTSADNTLLVAGNGTSSTPSDALVLDKDAGLVVKGEFNTGVIPAEDGGTRMMWYPGKAAFRAGYINSESDSGIGEYSIAFGYNSIASGRLSTALGNGTNASGESSTVMGAGTVASGESSTAMGDGTTANGQYSTAMGFNTTASGDRSVAMGNGTTASGNYSTAIGRSTTASAFVSTAMGDGTTASGSYSTAMGQFTTASGDRSVAMGLDTRAVTSNSLSIGVRNNANTSADNTAFVVGNGDPAIGTLSNALVLKFDGNMTIAGTLTQNSDRRLKKQIQPMGEGTLQKLGNIRPVRFQFKNQRTHPEGGQVGLIAQEVQKQFPELVSEASNGYLSVSYSKFTAVLLKGLQEQQQKIESLEQRIEKLEKLVQKTVNR